eukprot:COSAG04_NODE_4256_length_2203_cov_160.303707_1_plen_230_part_00
MTLQRRSLLEVKGWASQSRPEARHVAAEGALGEALFCHTYIKEKVTAPPTKEQARLFDKTKVKAYKSVEPKTMTTSQLIRLMVDCWTVNIWAYTGWTKGFSVDTFLGESDTDSEATWLLVEFASHRKYAQSPKKGKKSKKYKQEKLYAWIDSYRAQKLLSIDSSRVRWRRAMKDFETNGQTEMIETIKSAMDNDDTKVWSTSDVQVNFMRPIDEETLLRVFFTPVGDKR